MAGLALPARAAMMEQNTPPVDENQLIAERREKLKALREAQRQGKGVAFPNDFKPSDHAADLHSASPTAHREAETAKAHRG